MNQPPKASITSRLRERWLLNARNHQERVQRQADFDLKHMVLKVEFTRRAAHLRVQEIDMELSVLREARDVATKPSA